MNRRFFSLLACLSSAFVLTHCSGADDLPSGIFLRSVFSGGYLSNTIMVFKDGQVAYNPTGDLGALDFAKFAAENPKSVAKYTVSGQTLTITWSDGSKQTGEMKPDKSGGFDFGSAPHAPVKPLPSSARLEGTFTGGASIAGASTSVTYTFDGKGGYKTNSAGVVVTSTSASSVTAGNSGEDAGTYKVSGSRIQFTGSAGSREISLFYIPTSSGEASPDMLLLGGVVMTK